MNYNLLLTKPCAHPGVQLSYTRVYGTCTWGCTKSVHPGGDENCSLAK